MEDFLNPGLLQDEAGLDVQVAVAHALVNLMDHDRITPEKFRSMVYPLGWSIKSGSGVNSLHEISVRDATSKFFAIVAILLTDGDANKMNQMCRRFGGGIRLYVNDEQFVNKVKLLLKN